MDFSLFMRIDATILCVLLFIACILMVKLGLNLRKRFIKPDEPESKGGVNSLLGALFGLWGFLLAFTFGNSATRFESVRNIMVEEQNAIRNCIFRSKAFPDSISKGYQADLRQYLQARIDYYNNGTNMELLTQAKDETFINGNKLWDRTVQISMFPSMTGTANNMFTSLTNMYDIASKRDALLRAGIPEAIHYLLFFLALTISFIGGFTTPIIQAKEWMIVGGFALLACCIIYLSLDLGRPMRGFIRPEAGQQKIIELQKILE
jgi:hypothetical protein